MTHSVSAAISAADSLPPFSGGGICRSSSWYRMALIRRLSSGLPGTIAGPLSPPFSQPSRVSKARPPLVLPLALEWQPSHLVTNIGRIRFSKKSMSLSATARSGHAPQAIKARVAMANSRNRNLRHNFPAMPQDAGKLVKNDVEPRSGDEKWILFMPHIVDNP